MFEARLAGKSTNQKTIDDIQKTGLSKDAQNTQLSMMAEQDITESLFADLNVNANSLKTEVDYINFGKKVGAVLYEGQAPYRIPSFFKELVRDLSKQLESKKIKEILDSVTTIYNEKVKEEKEKEKTGGKNKGKATLKGAGKPYHNQNLIDDILGGDEEEEYGEEYGEEGEGGAKVAKGKAVKGKAKVQEEEFDFM